MYIFKYVFTVRVSFDIPCGNLKQKYAGRYKLAMDS